MRRQRKHETIEAESDFVQLARTDLGDVGKTDKSILGRCHPRGPAKVGVGAKRLVHAEVVVEGANLKVVFLMSQRTVVGDGELGVASDLMTLLKLQVNVPGYPGSVAATISLLHPG